MIGGKNSPWISDKADTTISSVSDVDDEVDGLPPLSPVITEQEKEAIEKDKNVIAHINQGVTEILLDFVAIAGETLNDDCKFQLRLSYLVMLLEIQKKLMHYLRYDVPRKESCNIVGHIIDETT